MDEQTELSIKEVDEEEQTENLEKQLKNAREEIQSLTQQLNCLLVLTKKLNIIFSIVKHLYILSFSFF